MTPFNLHPDIWGIIVLLGGFALLVAAALGWTKHVPGLDELLGGDPPRRGPEDDHATGCRRR